MKRGALLLCVLLAGCANPNYDGVNYTRKEWSKKTFDETVMACRESSMRRRKIFFTYVMIEKLFKACMEKNGYYYGEPSIFTPDRPRPVNIDQVAGYGSKRDIAEMPKVKPSETPDKSALYK
jgi:hypothetical protein